MPAPLLTALAAVVLAAVVISCWVLLYLSRRSRPMNAGGKARITGHCGDTLCLSLTFDNNRLVKGIPLTDGCAHSMGALLEAVRLARGMSPERIMSLEDDCLAMRRTGGMDEGDDAHCARLAVRVLKAAAADYLEGRGTVPSGISEA